MSACLLGAVACHPAIPVIRVPHGLKGDVDVDFCSFDHAARWVVQVDETGYGATALCMKPDAKYNIEIDGEIFHPKDPIDTLINDDGMVQSVHFVVR
ncbi:hypothetical protein [Silvibacterium acidisoli]|uniref:hypothetical protein n=1 Tax=Acidobacteriaceae bacterium ZG23-2 TaxID=2883246 RepID=UPI00406BFAC4